MDKKSAFTDLLAGKLLLIQQANETRNLYQVDRSNYPYITVNNKNYLSFSCNDVYGLSNHPEMKQAALDAIRNIGCGGGASRLVTGNHDLYQTTEQNLAAFKKKEAALLFGSGYLANLGLLSSIATAKDLILIDKLAHRCLYDGAKLSGAKLLRFKHNSSLHCTELLDRHRSGFEQCFIVTESVFSMDGDRSDLAALSAISNQYQAQLIVDDAHGLPQQKHHQYADIITGTCSKMLGSYGGYVAGNKVLIEYLISKSPSFIFTTSLPPAAVAATLKGLDILQQMPPASLERPATLATTVKQAFSDKNQSSHILPVIFQSNDAALAAQEKLRTQGLWAPAIRYPTVPKNKPRIRLSFSSVHNDEMIAKLLKALKEIHTSSPFYFP